MRELYSHKLVMWHLDAFEEVGIRKRRDQIDRRYALYPRRFYQAVEDMGWHKLIDFCFVGAFRIDAATMARRSRILPFIKDKFGPQSYLQFTDRQTKQSHESLGSYDHTLNRTGFVPKEMCPP